ncbi:MAG: sodium ion-translocating decarboxylase subunit beta [Chloroflexi bacterium]|nr:sodium ion-translocating decarboxylase subunit beta [Chloroflexota bacterium]
MAPWDRYLESLGLLNLTWGNLVLILVGLGATAIAVWRSWQPVELLPLGIGLVLANLPGTGLDTLFPGTGPGAAQAAGLLGDASWLGVALWTVLPALLFLGLGAATDLTPLIANPRLLALGAVAILVVLGTFWGALATGLYSVPQAAAVGVAGAAGGPLAVFTAAGLSPDRLELIAFVGAGAYLGAGAVAQAQGHLARRLTSRRERTIIMRRSREVSRPERLLVAGAVLVLIVLLLPAAAPLAGMFLVGNLLRESGIAPRLAAAAGNELLSLATLALALAIGVQLSADRLFQPSSAAVLGLGAGAALAGAAAGVLAAKTMNLFLADKVNPLVGAAALASLPLAAQAADAEGRRADPSNQLLPYALACNAAALLVAISVAAVFISVSP